MLCLGWLWTGSFLHSRAMAKFMEKQQLVLSIEIKLYSHPLPFPTLPLGLRYHYHVRIPKVVVHVKMKWDSVLQESSQIFSTNQAWISVITFQAVELFWLQILYCSHWMCMWTQKNIIKWIPETICFLEHSLKWEMRLFKGYLAYERGIYSPRREGNYLKRIQFLLIFFN